MTSTLYVLTVVCPRCGTGHLDGPGDKSTWGCRSCGGPLADSEANEAKSAGRSMPTPSVEALAGSGGR